MALATRCPHCSTTFRVANDQLKLHAGVVRCGKCQQTFNGVENLIPLDEHGRALSQSLPGQVLAKTATGALKNTETPVAQAGATPALSEAAPVNTMTPTSTPDKQPTTPPEPELSAIEIAKTELPEPAPLIESKALRAAEPGLAATAIQHVTPVSRPEVWRHAPTPKPSATKEISKQDSHPKKTETTEVPRAVNPASNKSSRPIARPIDSARLGDVWASQASKAAEDKALLEKIEPSLDALDKPSLRASDLEFDLSMPTRQFIDPALADEWFKLEQAALQQEADSTASAPPEAATTIAAISAESDDVRVEPQWETRADESHKLPDEARLTAPSYPLTTSETDHPAPIIKDAEVHVAPATPTITSSIAASTTEPEETASASLVSQTPESRPENLPDSKPERANHEPDEALLAKTLLMSEADADQASQPAEAAKAELRQGDEDSLDTAVKVESASIAPAAEEPEPEPELSASIAADEHEDAEAPAFVIAAERARRWSRITTVLMSLALLLLLPLLAAQIAYTGRNYLVQWYPPSKPYLVQACQYLQCQIKLPAQIDYVNIDSHELQAQIPEKNIYSLNLQIQNQSPFAQAWPFVELILHDKREKPVLRKVFSPADYLSPQELERATVTGLAAKGDYPIKLYFEQANTKASGYHVSVFYP